MNDAAFNSFLDSLVRGDQVSGNDELTRFAADLVRKEQGVMMPSTLKSTIATNLGIAIGSETATAAPVAQRRTRPEREFARRPWFAAAAVVIALSLALTGILQWSLPSGNDGDGDRSGIFSPAVPTASTTPATSAEASPADEVNWLVPITAEECQEDMHGSTPITLDAETYVAMPERVDEPYQPVIVGEGEDIIADARAIRACGEPGRTGKFTTGRFQYENFDRQFVVSDEHNQFTANRITRGRSLSTFYQQQMGMKPGTGNLAMPGDIDWLDGYEPGMHPVILPTSLVQLGDGRVVLLVTSITIPQPGEIVAAVPEPTTRFNAWVMIEQDGEWLLDELLPVCFGNCSQYWAIQPGANLVAAPVGSPTTVPFGSDHRGTPTPQSTQSG